jgi:hypothetical protein
MHLELIALGVSSLLLLAILLRRGAYIEYPQAFLSFAPKLRGNGQTKFISLAHDTEDGTLVTNVESCGVKGLAIVDTGSNHLVISLEPTSKKCLLEREVTPLYYGSENINAKQTENKVAVQLGAEEQLQSRVYWSERGDSILGLSVGNDVGLQVFEVDFRDESAPYLVINPSWLLKGMKVSLKPGNFIQAPIEVTQLGKKRNMIGVFDTGSSLVFINPGNSLTASAPMSIKTVTGGVDLGTFTSDELSHEYPPPIDDNIVILGLPFFKGKRVQIDIKALHLLFTN